MSASQMGERRIIELFLDVFKRKPDMPIPYGDDVSGVDLGNDVLGVLKTDMLVGKTDVPPGMTPRQAGWKAMVMSVSDFAAKGVKPQVALVAVGIPPRMGRGDIREVAVGLREAANRYGVRIIGGDTNESEELTVTSTTFGVCKKGRVILRSTAKPGDLLAVSGSFGKTSSGLKILLEGYDAPRSVRQKLVKSVYAPEARLDVGLRLKDFGATAAIDSSDGLAWSLYELSRASGVGFTVNRLPLDEDVKTFAEVNKLDPFELVFYGGEEYEVVATINPKRYAGVKEELKRKMLVIGKASKRAQLTYVENRVERRIKPKGWEHFKSG